eukprot:TRINITY_DN9171_c0_g1_i3.p1 TRINITY_DN9171_c0_g1~~TRINITY_DN9171_c0_g1_i3.p1  ORF type:complete len:202 (+),score=-21.96 TRINITY_DN9171_c0_g1_i3:889-1494(+)
MQPTEKHFTAQPFRDIQPNLWRMCQWYHNNYNIGPQKTHLSFYKKQRLQFIEPTISQNPTPLNPRYLFLVFFANLVTIDFERLQYNNNNSQHWPIKLNRTKHTINTNQISTYFDNMLLRYIHYSYNKIQCNNPLQVFSPNQLSCQSKTFVKYILSYNFVTVNQLLIDYSTYQLHTDTKNLNLKPLNLQLEMKKKLSKLSKY